MKAKQNRSEGKNKIVLTGGHAATTALATVEELIRDEKWDIYWIGSGKALEGKELPKTAAAEQLSLVDRLIQNLDRIHRRV